MSISDYTARYLREAAAICEQVDHAQIDAITRLLADQHDLCVRRPFSEHRLGRIPP